MDADVIKTYAELGLGVGLIASMAYQEKRGQGLALLNTGDLFLRNTTYLALRRRHFLRSYVYQFIQLCNGDLDMGSVQKVLVGNPTPR